MVVSKWLCFLTLVVSPTVCLATTIAPPVADNFPIVDGTPATDPVPTYDPLTDTWVLVLSGDHPRSTGQNGAITDPVEDEVTFLPETGSNAFMIIGLGGIALARLSDRKAIAIKETS